MRSQLNVEYVSKLQVIDLSTTIKKVAFLYRYNLIRIAEFGLTVTKGKGSYILLFPDAAKSSAMSSALMMHHACGYA